MTATSEAAMKVGMSLMYAFPSSDKWAECGMTLRDYFAAKAMQGLLAHGGQQWAKGCEETVARICYKLADAMVEARKK